ncbi:hypothetical protein I551_8792 [Mycobacterium ulcerans str. Harvey]|uniref:Uncharacterized protein n=1 Tax=Mycobacterium ulcerans str. Harvey TaxID=1299332 RepID=A0ABP3ASA4_MYCUL|nr:hypothetical protein I551_8792 [Mycobacterium ulcerans str. Harvey]
MQVDNGLSGGQVSQRWAARGAAWRDLESRGYHAAVIGRSASGKSRCFAP